MKRLLALVILALFATMILTGCETKGKCDECGQYAKLNKYTASDGHTYHFCDTCYRLARFIEY